jgi:hypothetical protein
MKIETANTVDHRVLRLEAENKQLREATQWQPIGTAPKDGSMLFLWSMGIHQGSWCIDEGYSGDEEPSWFDNSRDSFTTGYSASPLNPTHWMPLPEPPKDKQNED